ncbi:hypothetical protein [Paenibacillus planticolens]|uniref:hypothetical protein n=1 Tax=Paenibacillus planticolens TaxID=2654976 RepID=UPI001C113171|nr:hypothetical protein [Paenibacillus planticolens]
MNIYQCGDDAARMLPISLDEWRERAKLILATAPFGYGATGAGDTKYGNVDAFQKYRIRYVFQELL